jgi:hypothetical protein
VTDQRSNPDEDLITLGAIIATPFLLLGSIWFAFRDALLNFTLQAMLFQYPIYAKYLGPFIPDPQLSEMKRLPGVLSDLTTADMDFSFAAALWGLSGYGWRAFIAPIFIYWVIRLIRKPTASSYTGVLSRDELVKKMAPLFPNLPPILGEDIHKLPEHIGPWRVPRSYINFACEHQLLLYKDKDVFPKKAWTHKEMSLSLKKKRKLLGDYQYLSLNKEKADTLLASRLGSVFSGFDNMPLHWQALCGHYCAYIAEGKDALEKVLESEREIANSWKMTGSRKKDTGHTFSFKASLGLALLKEHCEHQDVVELIKKHYYNITFIIGLYEAARVKSPTTTNSVILLRPLDRRLYMCLNQVGGKGPFVETAAEWSQYYAECMTTVGAIKEPCITSGVDALELGLAEEQWIYDDGITDSQGFGSMTAGVERDVDRPKSGGGAGK